MDTASVFTIPFKRVQLDTGEWVMAEMTFAPVTANQYIRANNSIEQPAPPKPPSGYNHESAYGKVGTQPSPDGQPGYTMRYDAWENDCFYNEVICLALVSRRLALDAGLVTSGEQRALKCLAETTRGETFDDAKIADTPFNPDARRQFESLIMAFWGTDKKLMELYQWLLQSAGLISEAAVSEYSKSVPGDGKRDATGAGSGDGSEGDSGEVPATKDNGEPRLETGSGRRKRRVSKPG